MLFNLLLCLVEHADVKVTNPSLVCASSNWDSIRSRDGTIESPAREGSACRASTTSDRGQMTLRQIGVYRERFIHSDFSILIRTSSYPHRRQLTALMV